MELGALSAGCTSTVLLGGDCADKTACDGPTHGDGDALGSDGDGDGDGAAGDGDGDASNLDAGSKPKPDGGHAPVVDAFIPDPGPPPPGPDGGPGTPFPAFQNPSFERTSGTGPGDLAVGATGALAPWVACAIPIGQFNFLRVEQDTFGVTPTDGSYFLGYSYMYFVNISMPVAQTLQIPLKAGQRYAFLVDVRSQSGSDEQLGLLVKGGTTPCVAPTTLAEGDYLPNDVWTTQCITFTPSSDLSEIAFMPKNKNGIAITNRFYVDNIRPDPSCQ
ncbi:MAG: hypothetical protein QM778_29925 [Myxococcales bacterium]